MSDNHICDVIKIDRSLGVLTVLCCIISFLLNIFIVGALFQLRRGLINRGFLVLATMDALLSLITILLIIVSNTCNVTSANSAAYVSLVLRVALRYQRHFWLAHLCSVACLASKFRTQSQVKVIYHSRCQIAVLFYIVAVSILLSIVGLFITLTTNSSNHTTYKHHLQKMQINLEVGLPYSLVSILWFALIILICAEHYADVTQRKAETMVAIAAQRHTQERKQRALPPPIQRQQSSCRNLMLAEQRKQEQVQSVLKKAFKRRRRINLVCYLALIVLLLETPNVIIASDIVQYYTSRNSKTILPCTLQSMASSLLVIVYWPPLRKKLRLPHSMNRDFDSTLSSASGL